MANALCFFLVFTYQIWRLRKFRQKVVHVIDLTYSFHQEDESRQCQVVRHSALEFVDGGQSDAGLLRYVFLGEPAAHPVILETCAHQSDNFWCPYKSAIVLSLFNYHYIDSCVAIQPIIYT